MLVTITYEGSDVNYLFMMTKEMNDIKELEGQPWSSWKNILGNPFQDLGTKNDTKTKNPTYDESSCCMKLQRADMVIFGLCPTTELFQLAVCNLCGKKLKLPALAEHIKIRHSNENSSPASVKCDKSEKQPQKKGKLKKTKEKPKAKDKNDVQAKTQVNIDSKVDFMEIVSDRQSLPLDSENLPKFKQINLKINKKNQKNVDNDSCKEDSNLLDKGTTSVSKKECVTEISCKSSAEPVWPKAHVKLGNSAIAQDGEVINMQPIVQLSPLSASTSSTPFAGSPNISKTVHENKKNILEHQPSNSAVVDRNPDTHCGVIEKESSKPCTQSLNCSSHSLALKKAVQGRSKPVEVLLNNKKHDSGNFGVAESSSVNLDKVNSPVSTKSVITKPQTSTSSSYPRNEKTDSVDDNETRNKVTKRLTSDRPRLSLPVSIKNPTILCQLQNKVMKSKFSLPAEATRNESIQDVIKGNFSQKQIRNTRACRASKENSRAQQHLQKKEGNVNSDSSDNSKASDVKVDGYDQWHPGYRRVGGLLYASHNIPCVNRSSVMTSTSLARDKRCSSVNDSNFNIIGAKSTIIDLCNPSVNKLDLKKIQFEIDCGVKKTVSSLSSKQKGHVLISTNSPKNQCHKQKIIVNQPVSNNNNKTMICKRTNNNINGAVPAKIKKQEGLVNIVRPVFGKNDHTLPVMHLEVANNVFEKQMLTPAEHIPPQNSLGTSVQTGLNVIRGNSIRIGPPRIHYITASGPLPVSIQQVASVQQLQLKQMRVQHKYQLLSPQVNITPTSGVFYIQKTPASSSNVNGIEER